MVEGGVGRILLELDAVDCERCDLVAPEGGVQDRRDVCRRSDGSVVEVLFALPKPSVVFSASS